MTSPELKEGQTARSMPPKACTECKAAMPTQNPTVTCSSCNAVNPVASSNLNKHMASAARAVKKTTAAVVNEAKLLADRPSEFNCEHCNTALRVGTSEDTSDVAMDSTDAPVPPAVPQAAPETKAPAVVKLTCGACQRVTSVPRTNFQNALRRNAAVAARAGTKVYFTISQKPSVTCSVCNTVVAIPVVQGEQVTDEDDLDAPKRAPIPCPKCHSLLQPIAQ
jgi:Zn finger protein HypA/HybF involved in hydrogenase expression